MRIGLLGHCRGASDGKYIGQRPDNRGVILISKNSEVVALQARARGENPFSKGGTTPAFPSRVHRRMVEAAKWTWKAGVAMALYEADTCRRYIVSKRQETGWGDDPHRINEQVAFTDGRIILSGRQENAG